MVKDRRLLVRRGLAPVVAALVVVGAQAMSGATAAGAATSADLAVTMTGPSQVLQGQPFSYQVTVANAGPGDSSGATVVDDFPTVFSTHVASGSTTAGTCTTTQEPNAGGFSFHDRVTCNLGPLAAGASATVTLSLGANATLASGPQTDTVSVTGADGDTNPANNGASVTTVFNPADVALSLTGPSSAYTQESFVDTLTVANNGPATPSRIDVFIDYSGAQPLSVAATGAACSAPDFTYCTVDGLAAGRSAAIAITVASGAPGPARVHARASLQSGYDAATANNQAAATTSVVAPDTTPPVMTLPGATTAEATGPSGAAVTYAASARDAVDGPVAISCAPASGATFPLGPTTVACTARDAAGNVATGGFVVTVVDTTGPALAGVPAGQTVDATSPNGGVATWPAPTANDAVDGPVPVICTPASGATFPIGSTTVTCTATDAHGNTTSATFTVSVRGPAEELDALLAKVQGATADTPGKSFQQIIAAAKASYAAGQVGDACAKLSDFVSAVNAQSGKKLTETVAADFVQDARRIQAAMGCAVS